jgi:type I restriction enzyme S subunit
MRDNWNELIIGDEISILNGFPFNSTFFNDEKVGLPLIRIRDLLNSSQETYYSGKYSNAFIIYDGDILVGMDGDFHIVKWKNSASLLNQRILKIEKKKNSQIDIDYLFYYLQPFLLHIHNITAATTVKHLSSYDIINARKKFPPLPQQQKISKILSTCDEVIEKTEAAIAKYQAIKQGMMHDLFTRGIDVTTGKLRPKQEEAPHLYKESELGWIPKEWEVKKLEDLCNEKPKYGINAAAVEFNPKLPTYLRITDINEDGEFSKIGRKCVDNQYSNQYILQKGDLVFARTGATVGKTYLYKEEDGLLVYAGFLIKVTPNSKVLNSNFLKFLTETGYYNNWVLLMSQRSGQPGINGAEFGVLKIPTPNIDEQNLISSKILGCQIKIQTEQSALLKYQQIKAGLMQDLLSGTVEVEV